MTDPRDKGEGEGPLGLHAGSRMPHDADEVDALLRLVPEIAFVPEVAPCLFSAEALAGLSLFADPAHLTRLADEAYVERLRAALSSLRDRALLARNGGLEFLATTLSHFLDQIPPGDHPLVVALWCRSWARRRGRDDVPAAIAAAMDEYESTRGTRV